MSRARAIIERKDVENVQALRTQASNVLQAWIKKLRGLMPRLFPYGRTKSTDRLASHELNSVARDLSSITVDGLHYVFCGPFGNYNGEYKPAVRNSGTEAIFVYNPAFQPLMALKEAAFLQYNDHANPRRKMEARKEAYDAFNSLQRDIFTPQVLQTLIHEITHQKDDKRYPIAREAERREQVMTKKMHQKGLTQNDVWADYMGNTSEQNAHFTHALNAALNANAKTFDDFAKAFMTSFGHGKWRYVPERQRKKIISRAYQAWQQHSAKAVVEELLG